MDLGETFRGMSRGGKILIPRRRVTASANRPASGFSLPWLRVATTALGFGGALCVALPAMCPPPPSSIASGTRSGYGGSPTFIICPMGKLEALKNLLYGLTLTSELNMFEHDTYARTRISIKLCAWVGG